MSVMHTARVTQRLYNHSFEAGNIFILYLYICAMWGEAANPGCCPHGKPTWSAQYDVIKPLARGIENGNRWTTVLYT